MLKVPQQSMIFNDPEQLYQRIGTCCLHLLGHSEWYSCSGKLNIFNEPGFWKQPSQPEWPKRCRQHVPS